MRCPRSNDLLRGEDRCSGNGILRKYARNSRLPLRIDHSNIEITALLDARLYPCCLESLRECHPGFCILLTEHINILHSHLWIHRHEVESCAFIQAKRDVHVLNRLPCRSLDEIVNRGKNNNTMRTRINMPCDIAVICSTHILR